MNRYQVGVCYNAGGAFFSGGIRDTETGEIYPLPLDIAETVVASLNSGMPFPGLLPGVALTFKTIEEATDV